MLKKLRLLFVLAALLGTLPVRMLAAPNDSADLLHRIKHVFVIVLENEGFDVTFGPNSKAPFLSRTLTSQGVLLNQYYGTGHVSLDNYIAMLSGQAATPQTRNDCQVFQDFALTGVTPDGQAIGSGCVYPASIKTLPDQLNAIGKTWRGYAEDMGNDPNREAATCGHPALNSVDHTQASEAPSAAVPLGDQYASRHNPFVYFHSIIDSPDCGDHVVNLNLLPQDLLKESTTPNFVFITPNLCNDGHDAPCKNGQPGGLVSADAFLQKWIPMITNSPAYQRDGLIVINFDEGGLSVQPTATGISIFAPGLFCCNEQPGPNLAPFPQTTNITPTVSLSFQSYGGDRTGAVLLSPFLEPGTVSFTPFNHYSFLKSMEDIFDTDSYLGYAGAPGLVGFFGCVTSDIQSNGPHQSQACGLR
ncbi:MAG TPA: alkaline phosphatase family protein [Candidatus Acidoferrales bacterium]|nr:alkaline phosphatase family protein [Candidatus Acidoferrales bacterium]